MSLYDNENSIGLPLHEIIVHKNTTARAIELVILSLLVSVLVYRVVSFKDQDHNLSWVVAFLCELWFTYNWILSISIKWNQCSTKTYPERLLKRVSDYEFPAVDMFVTTADPILEPAIITMNTVLSLLAVDYPTNKLALYLSDDGCSPLTFYSLVETAKFAKLWVPFCKKYKVQVRAPFRYFTPNSTPLEDASLEFQQEWKKTKKEYGEFYKKIELASQRPFPCDCDSDFAVFSDVKRSDHPSIIKVVSETKQGTSNDIPHVIYISRQKSPKHHHHYKAGAMNVLARVSGLMTNAPLMLNVDCDMYANNPQVILHAMCMVFGFKNEADCAFVQFPQAFYDGLKDDPFGNQLADLYSLINGIQGLQGMFYSGTNCFHRRKVIYGSYPNDAVQGIEDLHKIFGQSIELKESAAHILSNAKTEKRRSPSNFLETAIRVAGCSYEDGTKWGKQIGWQYGSAAEDILTGLNIHGRGWKTVLTSPEPLAFLGSAPTTYPSTLKQQKRWGAGMFEVLFTNKNPLLLTIKGKLWFRQALAYIWVSQWAIRSVPEICYATLPAYCIFTGSNFLPKVNEPIFVMFVSLFVIYYAYTLWEVKRIGVSIRMWWNLQRMRRVTTVTAWLFGFLSVVLKLAGLSAVVFEITQKEQRSDGDDDDVDACRFTFDKSPIIVPGVVLLLVNLTALVNVMSRLLKVDFNENWIGVLRFEIGEMFCSVWVILCFWEYLKGLFGNGKYGIPFSTIWKSGALALFFVQLCRKSSQLL